eukprot:maker-scaffold229_size244821-snap-gene-1.17 protein:Tk01406 transcript:maker-scaffold229_size244821-snap-gene-1.17-mRNA-1 annotation:"glutathione s-transferase delta-epsilon 2"
MPIELYGMDASAPFRIVYMTLEALDIPYEIKTVNLQEGDHMKPEYVKMNPQHNIPAIKDGNFVMNESRAIAMYLANAYGKDSSIYPTDNKVRAVVDQRLYFDGNVFYKSFGECVYPKMFENKESPQSAFDKMKEVLGWVNDMIKPTGYVAGTDKMTLADVAFLATHSSLVATGAIDVSEYPELAAWFEKMKGEIKNYEKANGKGAALFGSWYTVKVFGTDPSAPVRIVTMVLEILDIPYEFRTVSLVKGDHMKPEFLKINPQHNIPAIKDDSFCMNESRAIAMYLANANGEGSSLYPDDPQIRAVVDQRLYFDGNVFYKTFSECVYPKMFEKKEIPQSAFDKMQEVLAWVNDMIKTTGYAAGTDKMTLADVAFLATHSTMMATGAIDVSEYPELTVWFEKFKVEVKNYQKRAGLSSLNELTVHAVAMKT